jgi:glycosyltransferase involved in cell wall biosynthesis
MSRKRNIEIDPSRPDESIQGYYSELKDEMRQAADHGDADKCLDLLWTIWIYMNRFRNCDLRHYFDADLHRYVEQINPKRFDTQHLLKPKKSFRIAFIIAAFSDTGSASIPLRYILEQTPGDVFFKQYVLVSNVSNETTLEQRAGYHYLRDNVDLEDLEIIAPDKSWVRKGQYIEQWLYDREIDFAVVDVDPASLYAMVSRPTLISGTLSQDSHTFTVGPGVADFTFLVTRDQAFKYEFDSESPMKSSKLLLLPLHSATYIQSAIPIDRCELGVPDDAVVSASTNIWKSCFGDGDVLLQGIATLVRRYPKYHHVFAGTPRAVDALDYFLSRNRDVQNSIHYVGTINNLYRLLKSVDFYINSFPISGGSDIEAAAVGIPSIELLGNRNFNLHEPEFLQSFECLATSVDEFVRLGERFINDPDYRRDLGRYLQEKVTREFSKERVLKERMYEPFVQEFNRRLNGMPTLAGLELKSTIQYEKLMGLWTKLSGEIASAQCRNDFLRYLVALFPDKPFAWIKWYEEVIRQKDKGLFSELDNRISETIVEKDARIQVMQSLCWRAFGDLDTAINKARVAVGLSTYNPLPKQVLAKLLLESSHPNCAKDILCATSGITDDMETDQQKEMFLEMSKFDLDRMPMFYDY